MGAFESEIGDEWDPKWPLVISGHIHERQRPQANVLYPGSVLTHAFGGRAEADQGLSIFSFDGELNEERISLGLKPKKTVHVKAGQGVKVKDLDHDTRIVITGTVDEISAHKSSKQRSVLTDSGAKVVYKIKGENIVSGCSFTTILESLIKNTGDPLLIEDYKTVM